MSVADPTSVGRFAIQRRLGAGAMGVVLVGRDDTLDREVAVKLVRPGGKPGKRAEAAKVRMLREAQAMARVAHPNVVAIYEAGLHDDGLYIAMELVQGQALDAWLEAEPRSVEDILARFVQAGRGLAAAHARGIVHRDFKPANVLVGDDGRTHVGDFGLARAAGHVAGAEEDSAPSLEVAASSDSGNASPGSGNVLAAELTHQGAMLGTPAFMSLEHFKGKATAQSDQWSFGVALYRALFGVAPYVGDGVFGLYEAIVNGPAPEPPARADLPAPIRAALMRALTKEPEGRWPSMDAFMDAIEAEVRRDPDRDPKRSRRQRQTISIGIGIFGVISGVMAAARSELGQTLTLRDVLVQAVLALLAITTATFVFRKGVLADGHGRRVVLVFFLIAGVLVLHRFLALFSDQPLVAVLRGDAVAVAGISVLAGALVERWLILIAALMGAFTVVSFVWPPASVAAFGMAIVTSLSAGVWFWREPDVGPT